MASSYSKGVLVAVSALSGCAPHDVELFPEATVTPGDSGDGRNSMGGAGSPIIDEPGVPEAERCDAAVPAGLLGARPPMGWNGWTSFECAPELNEAKVRATVDAMVTSGLQTAGYTYVNLDRCWDGPRASDGSIAIDDERLPGGVSALSRDLHERGFRLGFHRHSAECADIPSDRETADAAQYAAWGVDFLKLVSCSASTATDEQRAGVLTEALKESGRDIVLALAVPGFQEWMTSVGQTFRVAPAIAPSWESILSQLDAVSPLAAYARPGAFNDPDFLVVGIEGTSESEQRAQFSLWSILAAPLLASNDVTRMSESARRILTNQDLIAWNQDPLGLQAALVRQEDGLELYAKPLAACGARAVVLLNRSETNRRASLSFSQLWLEDGSASVRDLWSGEEIPSNGAALEVDVPPHDVRALEVVGVEPSLERGELRLGDASFSFAANGYGPVERNTTNGEQPAGDGQALRMRGRAYADGLGVHPPSLVRFHLGGACSRFTSQVGIDDEGLGAGSVVFQVWSDGEKLFDSGTMTGKTPPQQVDVSLRGRRDLRLFVGTTGDGFAHDHSDWAEARLYCATESSTR